MLHILNIPNTYIRNIRKRFEITIRENQIEFFDGANFIDENLYYVFHDVGRDHI